MILIMMVVMFKMMTVVVEVTVMVREIVVVMMKGSSAIQWFQLRLDGKTGAPKHFEKLR